jgi:sugar/nucleoside kinase (ribokinase family)
VIKSLFTVGEVLAVFLAHDPELSTARRYERITSGAEVNVAAGFVAAGHRASLVSRVGDDSLGVAVERDLRGWGLDLHLTRDAERHTGVLVRTVGGNDRGDAVNLRRGAAIEAVDAGDIDRAWKDHVDAIFVSGTTAVRSGSARGAVERMVERATAAGSMVVVDPNVRPALGTEADFREALMALRGRIDIALGDRRELALLAGADDSSAVEDLLRQGARLVVEKRGRDGVVAFDSRGEWSYPALVPSSEVVDTVGAGDAFTAGLIAAVLEGDDVQVALERGSQQAAAVVRFRGDVLTDYRKGISP